MHECMKEKRRDWPLGCQNRDTRFHLGRVPGEMMLERRKGLVGVNPDWGIVFQDEGPDWAKSWRQERTSVQEENGSRSLKGGK